MFHGSHTFHFRAAMKSLIAVAFLLVMCICNYTTGQNLRTLLGDEGAAIDLLSSTGKPSHKPTKKPSRKPSMHPTYLPSSPPGSGLVIPSEMVAEHNVWRSEVRVGPISYSSSLANSAQAWATHLQQTNGCNMMHSGDAGVGENLFWASAWSNGPAQTITNAQVVDAWGSEKQWYDYATSSCIPGNECLHYTQIVWAATTMVGCGAAICSDNSQVWVCQYSPQGNIIGQKPY